MPITFYGQWVHNMLWDEIFLSRYFNCQMQKTVDCLLVETFPALWLMPIVAALKALGHLPRCDGQNQWWLHSMSFLHLPARHLGWACIPAAWLHLTRRSHWIVHPCVEANTHSEVFRKQAPSLRLRDVVGLGWSLEGSSLKFSAKTQCV